MLNACYLFFLYYVPDNLRTARRSRHKFSMQGSIVIDTLDQLMTQEAVDRTSKGKHEFYVEEWAPSCLHFEFSLKFLVYASIDIIGNLLSMWR